MDRPPIPIPERTSSKNIVLPKRYSSIMPGKRQASLDTKYKRTASLASDVSTMSGDSAVSEFLAQKIRLHRSSMEYIRDYQNGLSEARSSENLQQQQYDDEMNALSKESEPILEELRLLEKQERTLGLDITEWCEDNGMKRQKTSDEPPLGFMQRAYAAVMVPRVMANAKQNRTKFDHTKFRKDVIKYLHAQDESIPCFVWCHVTGWTQSDRIKAAHLVPKCLKGDELTHLFGVGEVVLSDPSNGKVTILHCPAYPFIYS